jgi:hypothetical protein
MTEQKLPLDEIASQLQSLSEDELAQLSQAVSETFTRLFEDEEIRRTKFSAKVDMPPKPAARKVPFDEILGAVQYLNLAELDVLSTLVDIRPTNVNEVSADWGPARLNFGGSKMVALTGPPASADELEKRKKLMQALSPFLSEAINLKVAGDKQQALEVMERAKEKARQMGAPDEFLAALERIINR